MYGQKYVARQRCFFLYLWKEKRDVYLYEKKSASFYSPLFYNFENRAEKSTQILLKKTKHKRNPCPTQKEDIYIYIIGLLVIHIHIYI